MLLPKDNSLLLKAVQNNCFRRSTLRRNSRQKLLKRKAFEDKSFPKLPQHLLEQRLPRLTLTKTSADCTLCAPRTPQQNGVAERRNRTLIEAARTMLSDAKLPITFWAEAVNTACYVQSRVLVVKTHGMTPYEIWHKRKPFIGFLKPFGCHCTILNTKDHLAKFAEKSAEGYFVGYSSHAKAYRVYIKASRIIEESANVQLYICI
ncbi:hypothetical protein E3N88_40064 [Mikania micrantha]|uniref:Integrase catalytic domain-containing protein n=1 Tax=Mikania micrantha TaxID=192012 RepID=A0A5N6LLP9_9ASTR|nr:hypothetical protein E3N88_40064 [Mikania micrantha]